MSGGTVISIGRLSLLSTLLSSFGSRLRTPNSRLLSLSLLFLSLTSLSAQDITGAWSGALEPAPGMRLRLVFHIEATDDGYTSTLDSPDQGATGIPTSATTYVDGELKITSDRIGLVYTATLEDDELIGTFQQAGQNFDLNLSRGETAGPELRPQDPRDFPYAQEEVTFRNEAADVTLAGTLTLPPDGKPEQVVVLVSGSGAQNRDEELAGMNHRPFLVLSDYLTRQGIGVLRYDDRGVGESTGSFSQGTSYDFAQDAKAAVAYLRSREDLAGAELGIVGHSEGGLIAPIVANEDPELDFIVLLAGPGTKLDQLLVSQTQLMARANGASEKDLKDAKKDIERYAKMIRKNPDLSSEELEEKILADMQEQVAKAPDSVKAKVDDIDALVAQQAKTFASPWFRYFIKFDPAPYLRRVDIPVLAVNGSLDLQVPSQDNLQAIEKALRKGKNKDYTIHEFPGLNHLFQTATTGAMTEYANIDETFNEEAMRFVADWILAR